MKTKWEPNAPQTDQVDIDDRMTEWTSAVTGHDTLGTHDNWILVNKVNGKVWVHLITHIMSTLASVTETFFQLRNFRDTTV